MPFVNKHKDQYLPPSSQPSFFIGRDGETEYFIEGILKPLYPHHNIISIYGQGGVGKSTLVQRIIKETKKEEFQGYCHTALVDERQTTLTDVIERLAEQLHLEGEFRTALIRYKEALRKLQQDHENTLEKLGRDLSAKFAGEVAGKVPIPLLNDIAKQGATDLVAGVWDSWHYRQQLKEVKHLENPIRDLTLAFLQELHKLT